MEPTRRTLLKREPDAVRMNAYGISMMIAITTCNKRSDAKLFNQLLKIPSLERVQRHSMANGDRMINTLMRI